VTDKVPPGVVRLEHGFWADAEKPNVNDLVEPTLQDIVGDHRLCGLL